MEMGEEMKERVREWREQSETQRHPPSRLVVRPGHRVRHWPGQDPH